MKKRLLGILLCGVLTLTLAGCTTYDQAVSRSSEGVYEETYGGGYFTVIAKWDDGLRDCYIVYANDTKVKYLICTGNSMSGITPLYNSDGTLQIYEEE